MQDARPIEAMVSAALGSATLKTWRLVWPNHQRHTWWTFRWGGHRPCASSRRSTRLRWRDHGQRKESQERRGKLAWRVDLRVFRAKRHILGRPGRSGRRRLYADASLGTGSPWGQERTPGGAASWKRMQRPHWLSSRWRRRVDLAPAQDFGRVTSRYSASLCLHAMTGSCALPARSTRKANAAVPRH